MVPWVIVLHCPPFQLNLADLQLVHMLGTILLSLGSPLALHFHGFPTCEGSAEVEGNVPSLTMLYGVVAIVDSVETSNLIDL